MVVLVIVILFFVYSKETMVECKQRDLKNKSPLFSFFNETISGLVQIRTYGRRKDLISQFTKLINRSTKAAFSYDIVSRAFAFYVTVIGIILMAIGMEVGIQQSTPLNYGLYGMTVVFLIGFTELLNWNLRQMNSVESLMLSSERAFQIINLKS